MRARDVEEGRYLKGGVPGCRIIQKHDVGAATALLVAKPWSQQKLSIGREALVLTVFKHCVNTGNKD